MEKIKQESGVRSHKSEKESDSLGTEIIGNENDPVTEFNKKWKNSPFSDKTLLEKISEEVEAIEKDYEYSKEELGEMQKITETMTDQIRLLETAVKQNHSGDICECALKIINDLSRIAKIADQDALVLLRRMVLRNPDPIIQTVEQDLPGQKYARILLLEIAQGNPDEAERITPILKKYIETTASKNGLDEVDVKIMSWIYFRENEKDIENHYIQILWEHFQIKPEDYKVILACIEGAGVIQEIGKRQVFEMLKQYNLERDAVENIIQKWLYAGGSEKYMPVAFGKNIETIKSVEEKRPGITKFLILKLGIYNFGRYPEELLIKQYDEYENQNLPYGVVLFAEDDHNGVYFEYKDELEKLAKSLDGKYIIRIGEIGGKKDLMRLLVRLRLKYGKDHKISFGILGAHGNRDIITLGNVDNYGDREIYRRNVQKYGNRKYDLFDENATLILLSCQSGQKKAIGNEVSKAMNVATIAPRESSGLDSIKAILDKEGQLGFKVKYSHHIKAAIFRPGRRKKKEFI